MATDRQVVSRTRIYRQDPGELEVEVDSLGDGDIEITIYTVTEKPRQDVHFVFVPGRPVHKPTGETSP